MGFKPECLFLFEAFYVGTLQLVEVVELGLFALHLSQLFLFKNLHSGVLKGLTAKRRKERFDIIIEKEDFIVLNKCLFGNSHELWHRPRSFDFRNVEGSLACNFILRCFVSELCDELVSLDIDVLFASGSFWRLNVSCEEFLSGLSTLLFDGLGVVLFFVCSEELIWV